ncbi:hypothetical protein B0H34DRAFT_37492 [Crassisporium funariophilum]|nr:hypothetical protein B0H34DRAFT_37492 [Crassisporium funariophilum]
MEVANERKSEGNECFRAGKWNEALVAYRSGLNCLPKRLPKPETGVPDAKDAKLREETVPTADVASLASEKPVEPEPVIDIASPAVSEEDKECGRLRSVLNANIGACHVKLGEHKEAVAACSQALLDDPTYVKALERRALSNDALDSWTSLTAVQEDYNTLLKLSTSASQQADIRRKLQSIKPRLETAQKKETGEMVDKLKGLGNSIGNFGLSTDNFKFEPNGQGGYSVNFSR